MNGLEVLPSWYWCCHSTLAAEDILQAKLQQYAHGFCLNSHWLKLELTIQLDDYITRSNRDNEAIPHAVGDEAGPRQEQLYRVTGVWEFEWGYGELCLKTCHQFWLRITPLLVSSKPKTLQHVQSFTSVWFLMLQWSWCVVVVDCKFPCFLFSGEDWQELVMSLGSSRNNSHEDCEGFCHLNCMFDLPDLFEQEIGWIAEKCWHGWYEGIMKRSFLDFYIIRHAAFLWVPSD